MEEVNQLTDFERKLITIIQHNTRKGHNPSIKELELRSGRREDEIRAVTQDLIKRKWLGIQEGRIVVLKNLF